MVHLLGKDSTVSVTLLLRSSRGEVVDVRLEVASPQALTVRLHKLSLSRQAGVGKLESYIARGVDRRVVRGRAVRFRRPFYDQRCAEGHR